MKNKNGNKVFKKRYSRCNACTCFLQLNRYRGNYYVQQLSRHKRKKAEGQQWKL